MQAHSQQSHSWPRPKARRSVSLETLQFADGSCECVVKSFHHPGVLGRLFDGHRARREFKLLRRLAAAGLPVPKAIEIRRGPRGPQLVTQSIPSAKSLEHWLAGVEDWPAGSRQCAQALGALMAAAHAIGLEHGDIYPSNALLDDEGRAWLVDLGNAKLGPASLREQDLIVAAASVREQTSTRFRARFLRSYLNHLPSDLLAPGLQLKALQRKVEAQARLHRRTVVERHLGRWLRESGVCSSLVNPTRIGSRQLKRTDLDACEQCAADASGSTTHLPGSILVRGDSRSVQAMWLGAARALEHNLTAARPMLFNPGPQAWAVFLQPPSCAELFSSETQIPAAEQARALGRMFGLLNHRGLGLQDACAANFKLAADGVVHLQPGAFLETRDAGDPDGDRKQYETLYPSAAKWAQEFEYGRRAGEGMQTDAIPQAQVQGSETEAHSRG